MSLDTSMTGQDMILSLLHRARAREDRLADALTDILRAAGLEGAHAAEDVPVLIGRVIGDLQDRLIAANLRIRDLERRP